MIKTLFDFKNYTLERTFFVIGWSLLIGSWLLILFTWKQIPASIVTYSTFSGEGLAYSPKISLLGLISFASVVMVLGALMVKLINSSYGVAIGLILLVSMVIFFYMIISGIMGIPPYRFFLPISLGTLFFSALGSTIFILKNP